MVDRYNTFISFWRELLSQDWPAAKAAGKTRQQFDDEGDAAIGTLTLVTMFEADCVTELQKSAALAYKPTHGGYSACNSVQSGGVSHD